MDEKYKMRLDEEGYRVFDYFCAIGGNLLISLLGLLEALCKQQIRSYLDKETNGAKLLEEHYTNQ